MLGYLEYSVCTETVYLMFNVRTLLSIRTAVGNNWFMVGTHTKLRHGICIAPGAREE